MVAVVAIWLEDFRNRKVFLLERKVYQLYRKDFQKFIEASKDENSQETLSTVALNRRNHSYLEISNTDIIIKVNTKSDHHHRRHQHSPRAIFPTTSTTPSNSNSGQSHADDHQQHLQPYSKQLISDSCTTVLSETKEGKDGAFSLEILSASKAYINQILNTATSEHPLKATNPTKNSQSLHEIHQPHQISPSKIKIFLQKFRWDYIWMGTKFQSVDVETQFRKNRHLAFLSNFRFNNFLMCGLSVVQTFLNIVSYCDDSLVYKSGKYS
jgi:hypothetical protein